MWTILMKCEVSCPLLLSASHWSMTSSSYCRLAQQFTTTHHEVVVEEVWRHKSPFSLFGWNQSVILTIKFLPHSAWALQWACWAGWMDKSLDVNSTYKPSFGHTAIPLMTHQTAAAAESTHRMSKCCRLAGSNKSVLCRINKCKF